MQRIKYCVEQNEVGFSVVGSEGEVVLFADFERAVYAARNFSNRCLPKNWSHIPPAMVAAKKKFYK